MAGQFPVINDTDQLLLKKIANNTAELADSGGGGGGAPTDATFITQTPNASLVNEVAMSTLATGLVKNTTGTGVPEIAEEGIDFNTRVAKIVSQAAHGFVAGDAVYDNNGTFAKAMADAAGTSRPVGVVESAPTAGTFVLVIAGPITLSGLTASTVYYLSDATAGLLTTTAPTSATSFVTEVVNTGTATQAYVAIGAPAALAQISLTTDVTGTLPVANGGSGIATTTAYSPVLTGTTSTGAWKADTGPGDSGQVLTSNGAGAYPTWEDPSGGGGSYGLTCGCTGSNPGDGETLLAGTFGLNMTLTPGDRRVYIPKTGTIKQAAIFWFSNGANGTGEDVSIYIRNQSAATEELVQTVGNTAFQKTFANAAMTLAVTAGEYIELKIVCPTWATNPTSVFLQANIYIE